MTSYEVASLAAKEIVIKMMEEKTIHPGDYPDQKSYIDCVCAAYKKIYAAATSPID